MKSIPLSKSCLFSASSILLAILLNTVRSFSVSESNVSIDTGVASDRYVGARSPDIGQGQYPTRPGKPGNAFFSSGSEVAIKLSAFLSVFASKAMRSMT